MCVFVRLAGQPVILDAGSGIMDLPEMLCKDDRRLPLLLSHAHADHLIGLPMCPTVFDPQVRFDIYAAEQNGLSGEEQFRKYMSPAVAGQLRYIAGRRALS